MSSRWYVESDGEIGARTHYAWRWNETSGPNEVERRDFQTAKAARAFVEKENEDYDPSPWCSYGHMTEADCDCGPIAENE